MSQTCFDPCAGPGGVWGGRLYLCHKEQIRLYTEENNHMVHVFTDDYPYRKRYESLFMKAICEGKMTFGPVVRDLRETKGSSYVDNAKFTRETSVHEAMEDFVAMSKCEVFIGAAGSTITNMVRSFSQRSGPGWAHCLIIGDYNIQVKPTMRFRKDTEEFVYKAYKYIEDPSSAKVSHPQRATLNFLSDHHLKTMYEDIVNTIKTTDPQGVLAAKVGQSLLQNCTVAKLNKKKFTDHTPIEGGMHWLTALLRSKMKMFTNRENKCQYNIEISDGRDAFVYLLNKKSIFLPQTDGGIIRPSSSSSSTDGNIAKKQRTV